MPASSSASALTSDGPNVALAVKKACSVCGADVSDKKRMKDGTSGRYWCFDCYQMEQRKKSAGMTMRCPHCEKNVAPVLMVKHGDEYWCETCDNDFDSRGKKKKPATATAAPAASAGGIQQVTKKEIKTSVPEKKGSNTILIVFAAIAVVGVIVYMKFF